MGTLSLTDPVNGTTADASLVANNNAAIKTVVNGGLDNTNIAPGAGIAGSKIGATYSSYTPTWTTQSSAPAILNGTITGRYCQVGKVVTGYIKLTAGSTTTYGSGNYQFSFPVTAAATVSFPLPVGTWFANPATTDASGVAVAAGTDVMVLSSGTGFVNPTTPGTFASTNIIYIAFTYEAA